MKIRFAIFAALLLIAGIAIFFNSISQVVSAVLHREGSSHGVFIPFIAAYFIWVNREKFKGLSAQTDPMGIPLIVIGLIPAFLFPGSFRLGFLGFILVAAGLAWLLFGGAYFKRLAFPILFLSTMVPLPEDLYRNIAEAMRRLSTSGSVAILSFLGIPHHRSGWTIELPNTTLEVAMSCSGIRYLISYFMFGIAYAFLEKKTVAGRLAVVAASIPISIFAGIMRLTAIFIMTQIFGPKMGEHNPHIIISWAVFFGILILSICLDRLFSGWMESGKAGRLASREAGRLESLKGSLPVIPAEAGIQKSEKVQ